MAIQGISGVPNAAILSSSQTPVKQPFVKEEELVSSKLGAMQNSEAGAADIIAASLSAVTGKDTSAQMGRYTDLCSTLLAQQAKSVNGLASYYDASGASFHVTCSASIINLSIGIEFDEHDLSALSGMTSEEAEEAISEEGYWGVDAVASRIMDMAVALSGGDPDKIDLLQEAVMKGFDNAYGILGGEENAPDITKETQEEVERRFDFWRENGSLDGYSMTQEEANTI